ncbi:MAG: DinB family protein [Candidatus Delongbacteria bacterium]|nr:DinB family protein [Candidatus Delongbacteria bacterium]
MIPQIMQQVLGFNHILITRNTAGVDHAASLVTHAGSNCANWILGHILCIRVDLMTQLGLERLLDEMEQARYQRGRSGQDPDWLPFTVLLERFELSQQALLKQMPLMDAAHCESPGSLGPYQDRPMREVLVGFGQHEAYHAGQLGILRHSMGLEPAFR